MTNGKNDQWKKWPMEKAHKSFNRFSSGLQLLQSWICKLVIMIIVVGGAYLSNFWLVAMTANLYGKVKYLQTNKQRRRRATTNFIEKVWLREQRLFFRGSFQQPGFKLEIHGSSRWYVPRYGQFGHLFINIIIRHHHHHHRHHHHRSSSPSSSTSSSSS